jgi:maltose O-acetyltransferase
MILFAKKYFKKIFYLNKLKKSAILGENFLYNQNTKFSTFNKNQIEIANDVMFYGKIICGRNAKVTIEKKANIREGCIFYCANSIIIEEGVIFADNIILSDTNHHPINPEDRIDMVNSGWSTSLWSWDYADSKPIIIKKNCWIGQYSRILKGVTVGENSIVASNSVVTKSVPPNSIVAGNPAKVVKENIDLEPRKIESFINKNK